jgi:hypothetical protein
VDGPQRRLDDTDLDALEAAALGRTGAGALAHPVDVLRLVAEVRWYRERYDPLRANPRRVSVPTPENPYPDAVARFVVAQAEDAPRVVEPDRYMMRDRTPRPTGVPVPQFEVGAVLLHKFPELAGYVRETTLDDGGRAVVTYTRNHESNAVPPGEFPAVPPGYERTHYFRDHRWTVEYRECVPSFPKSAGGSDGDAPVVVTDGNN